MLMYIKQLDDGSVELTAPVMIPGAKDCDYEHGEEPLTKEQVSQFAESYKNYQFIDHEHGLTRNGAKIGVPVNSFLLTSDTSFQTIDGSHTYPSGTWMMTSQLTDEAAIQNALSGGYTGYSVSVFSKDRADQYLEALKTDKDAPMPSACKTINSGGNALIKDIRDPVVLSVSLVKSPCLHESKLCELNEEEIMTEEVSLKSKILDAMGMSEQAEVEALKSQVVSLESKIDEMQANFEAALKAQTEAFEKTLTEALTPVAEKTETEEEEEATEEEVVEVVEEQEIEEETEPEEEVPEEEPVAEKGESKAEPIHDNVAEKTQKVNIYEFMGRNADGTRRK